MGHYARGDSRKMICSSDDEEGYRISSLNPSQTSSTMSRLNLRDKRNLIHGTFGEAPPLPLPPISDETDRQFWAEDELSSCDSRIRMIERRKRRHSVAYRNRAAVHRSRSGLVDSSSSSTEPPRLNIPPSVRRRRRQRNCPGTSRVQKARTASSGVQTKFNTKTVSRMVAVGSNLSSGCAIVRPTLRNACVSTRQKNGETSGSGRTSQNVTGIPSRADAGGNIRKNRISKMGAPRKSRRK